jgi:putative membrane protein
LHHHLKHLIMKAITHKPFLQYVYLFCIYTLYTFMNCQEMLDWVIENILVLTFLIVLGVQLLNNKIQLSQFAMISIFIFLALHEWGAQYVYSHHPLGYWMQSHLHLQRNGYDRLVHFSFGLLFYFPARENIGKRVRLISAQANMRILQIVLCFASIFELIEFAVANYIFPDANGQTYVGMQGDVWDAQKDVALAIIGCIVAIMFGKIYEKVVRSWLVIVV